MYAVIKNMNHNSVSCTL